MNFKNYQTLCATMGAAQKAGQDLEADWELLEASIQALVGAFRTDAYANIQAITHGSHVLEIEDTATVRDAVNGLCERYGVALVCDPGETARQTAADVASQVVQLLVDQ